MERSTRVPYLSVALLVLTTMLALQAGHSALVIDDPGGVTHSELDVRDDGSVLPNDVPAGSTLVSVQSFGGFTEYNGRAMIVSPEGETVWEWRPPDAAVFDSEYLANGNVQVALAERVPAEDCPEQYRDKDHCVRNRVVEVDYDTKEVVWEYDWYDAFIHWHEVHDADRLADGRVAIIDMGNDRTFFVNREGEITWQWNATKHLGEGSEFREKYGGPASNGPEDDWTHMNDVDVLHNGYVQMSIRNFDSVIRVDPETDEIVRVFGRPDAHDVMKEQHNPQWLPERNTMLVADSENDRVVEITPDGEIIWQYGGSGELSWSRDADRLPNGNTLITDTYHSRVLEVNQQGEVRWEYEVAIREDGQLKEGIVYEADRLSVDGKRLAEERSTFETVDPNSTATVTPFPDVTANDGGELDRMIPRVEAWSRFYFPYWVEFRHLLNLAAAVLVGVWLSAELAWLGWRTYRN